MDQTALPLDTFYFARLTTNNHSGALWVVTLLGLIYTLFSGGARLWTRRGRYGADEWTLLACILMGICQHSAIIVALHYGLGKASELLQPEQITALSRVSKQTFLPDRHLADADSTGGIRVHNVIRGCGLPGQNLDCTFDTACLQLSGIAQSHILQHSNRLLCCFRSTQHDRFANGVCTFILLFPQKHLSRPDPAMASDHNTQHPLRPRSHSRSCNSSVQGHHRSQSQVDRSERLSDPASTDRLLYHAPGAHRSS